MLRSGAVGLVMVAVVTSGCAAAPATCDDAVRSSAQLPAGLARDGIDAAFGSGDVFFVVPQARRWSDLLTARGVPGAGKFAMWVGAAELPTVTVELAGARGSVDLSPTAEGLPGPVPMTITLPAEGCWTVTARTRGNEVAIMIANVR